MNTRTKITDKNTKEHIFTNRVLLGIILPCMLEQLLSSLMGTADIIMVSNISAEAISAASLVDSINMLVIQAFAALAAGGSIVCAHYFGAKKYRDAKHAAGQLLLINIWISLAIAAFCLLLNRPMLSFIFGQVDAEIMENAVTYFFYTALSFPFIALFNSGSAILRAQENSREPMIISVISNVMNVAGNALLIFVFHMGIAGAAISTLVSRIFCAVVVLILIRRKNQQIYLDHFLSIRPEKTTIIKILKIGIPSSIENSMFQLGKLAIQSTVSMLGTAAIAAQALANNLEALNGLAAVGIGIAMMTVVGEALGAGRSDEAVYYTKKLTLWGEIVTIISVLAVYLMTPLVISISKLDKESTLLCMSMMTVITIFKPFAWVLSFLPSYGMRAAGDVKFSMITSCITMWFVRYVIGVYCMRVLKIGPMGVWVGMISDWIVRSIIFSLRFHSRKWLAHKVA